MVIVIINNTKNSNINNNIMSSITQHRMILNSILAVSIVLHIYETVMISQVRPQLYRSR